MIRKKRIASYIDQSIWSVLNFFHIWLVAYFTQPESVSEYILTYGISLFYLRIHAAFVTMPLATYYNIESNRSNTVKITTIANEILIIFAIIFSILTYFLSILLEIDNLKLVSIASLTSVSLIITEYIRRFYLISNDFFALIYHNFQSFILIILGIITLILLNLQGYSILLGFSLAGIFSLQKYFKIKNQIFRHDSSQYHNFVQFINQNIPLAINNAAQWATGQASYYLAALLLNTTAVTILAILRNIFGPLNILILSLEGILPQKISNAYKNNTLQTTVKYEIISSTLIPLLFCSIIIYYKNEILNLVYSNNINTIIEYKHLVFMTAIYIFAIISRTLIITLRSLSLTRIISKVTYISFSMFIVTGTLFTLLAKMNGLIFSMATTEIATCILLYLTYKNSYKK